MIYDVLQLIYGSHQPISLYEFNKHLSHLNCRYGNIYVVAHPDFRYDWQHATVLGEEYMLVLILILQMWTVNHLLASYMRISNTFINYLHLCSHLCSHLCLHLYLRILYIVDVLKKVIDCFKTGVLELDRTEQQKITAMYKELKTVASIEESSVGKKKQLIH